MITAESIIHFDDGTAEISFTGLSTDTKPTETYQNMKIKNGSDFLEMNTQKLYFYDQAGKTWLG